MFSRVSLLVIRLARSPAGKGGLACLICLASCESSRHFRLLPHDPPAPWVVLLKVDTAVASFDPTRVQPTPEARELWVRYDLTTPMRWPMDSSGVPVFRTDIQEEVDCPGRRAREIWLRAYDSTGAVIYDAPLSQQPWSPFKGRRSATTCFCRYAGNSTKLTDGRALPHETLDGPTTHAPNPLALGAPAGSGSLDPLRPPSRLLRLRSAPAHLR